jgi:hypothetical protein
MMKPSVVPHTPHLLLLYRTPAPAPAPPPPAPAAAPPAPAPAQDYSYVGQLTTLEGLRAQGKN